MNDEGELLTLDEPGTGPEDDKSTGEYLTLDELAAEWGVTRAVIYGMRYRNQAPPAVRAGRALRFSRTALARWEAQNSTTGTRGRKAAS